MDDCLGSLDTAGDLRRHQSRRAGTSARLGTSDRSRSYLRGRRLVSLRVSHARRLRSFKTLAAHTPESRSACTHAPVVLGVVLRGVGHMRAATETRAHAHLCSGNLSNACSLQFWRQFGVEWLSWIFTTLPFGAAVYLCVVGIEHATRYFIEAREREVQVARLSEQLSSARFAALQAQLNPHFLFNTLNTIAVLVRDNDREGAVRIVEHLSEVLRRTLTLHRANEVTLGEELELVREYVAIEQARFSDRLRPEFRIPDSLLSAAFPSFALQHLVENAIRHGIAKHPDAGLLLVTAERVGDVLQITVINDGVSIDPNCRAAAGSWNRKHPRASACALW